MCECIDRRRAEAEARVTAAAATIQRLDEGRGTEDARQEYREAAAVRKHLAQDLPSYLVAHDRDCPAWTVELDWSQVKTSLKPLPWSGKPGLYWLIYGEAALSGGLVSADTMPRLWARGEDETEAEADRRCVQRSSGTPTRYRVAAAVRIHEEGLVAVEPTRG